MAGIVNIEPWVLQHQVRTVMVDVLRQDDVSYSYWTHKGWLALFDHIDGWTRVRWFEDGELPRADGG